MSFLSTQGVGLPGLAVSSMLMTFSYNNLAFDGKKTIVTDGIFAHSLLHLFFMSCHMQGTPGPIGLPGQIGRTGPKVPDQLQLQLILQAYINYSSL